jgi:hypothetical protein
MGVIWEIKRSEKKESNSEKVRRERGAIKFDGT